MEKLENKVRNLTYVTVLGFVIIIILLIGLYMKGTSGNNTEKKENNGTTSQTQYDVSKMKQITGDEAVKLFEEKGTHILYIGRPTCGVCVQMVPILNEIQTELKYTTNYIEFNTKTFETDLKALSKKLDYKTTITTTINGESKKLNDTIGNLMIDYGFTPIIVIIKDGKMVDGFIGYKNKDSLTTLIKKYI